MTEWTKEQQKEHRKLWIEALRSRKYKQGKNQLRDYNNNYCCLGVACEIAIKNGLNINVALEGRIYSYDGVDDILPDNVRNYYGLVTNHGSYQTGKYKEQRSLVEDNDDYQYEFIKISNIIEKEPEGLVE